MTTQGAESVGQSPENDELLRLANLWCEGDLGDEQLARMQQLLRSDGVLLSLFVRFMQVHGSLAWDAGRILVDPNHKLGLEAAAVACVSDPELLFAEPMSLRSGSGRRWFVAAGAVCCLLLAGVFGWLAGRHHDNAAVQVHVVPQQSSAQQTDAVSAVLTEQSLQIPERAPLQLNGLTASGVASGGVAVAGPASGSSVVSPVASPGTTLTDAMVVAEIDRLLERGWVENSVNPAAAADDYEWVRRAHLVLTGRISTESEANDFVKSADPQKRQQLIRLLAADAATAENLAELWTNLLIGRSNARKVDQDSLWTFLRSQFADNRPWMETVGRLIAAEGRSDRQGETNFLLAHLNDQATPATAVTARLFLGRQVHCTQCHDHPFARERRQDEFWTLNAFFKQAVRERVDLSSSLSGSVVWSLRDDGREGMTFYENLRGQQKAVLPEFGGQVAESSGSRRAALAKLLAEDDQLQVSKAMVNRVWAMFFGYGFTNPIDDLGPHNPASHPELFDYLTKAFAESGYDLRRLLSWVAMSRAFGLSSEQPESLVAMDDPQEGGLPLFSRIYARPMGPEQVYDSLRTAIGSLSGRTGVVAEGGAIRHRREWVEQFVRAWGTDDNEESLVFGSDISQALQMMNGRDLEQAIPQAAATAVNGAHPDGSAVTASLRHLALGTLNREPTEQEERIYRNRYRTLTRTMSAQDAMKTAAEDMLWAYLNSSEFVSVH